jgi:glycosyltransferase involved in cell wall biosynthesis
MDSTVSVTIGIPTYNRPRYLKEAVASALAQTYPNVEILISQNPHSDPRLSAEIADYCRSIAIQHRQVAYECQPRNIGQTGNYQWLINNARGDYIFLIGDDDRILPSGVETLVKELAEDVAVVFGRRKRIDADGRVLPRCVHPSAPDAEFFEGWPFTQYQVPAGRLANAELWTWRQAMGVETSLIRTKDFRTVGYPDIDMPDVEFFILLARERAVFVAVPEYVTEYRAHMDSSTGRGFNDFRALSDDLSALDVSDEIEPYKRKLMGVLVFKAVSKCLLAGQFGHARRLLASKYYPADARAGSKGLAIRLCAVLPEKIAPSTYNFLYSVKNRRRYKPAGV